MSISLKITSYQRLTPGQLEVFNPDSESFTIGRSNENDWALTDPNRFLSGVHCRIHNKGGEYYITDTSTNGVFLNGSEQRMARNETLALNAGDSIKIGDYEFEVLIDDPALAGNPATSGEQTSIEMADFDDPFADLDPTPSAGGFDESFEDEHDAPIPDMEENVHGTPPSIDSLMGLDDDSVKEDHASAEDLEQQYSPLRESFRPSGAVPGNPPMAEPASQGTAGGIEIPENWDEATGMFVVPTHEDRDSAGQAGDDDFPDDDDWGETGMGPAPIMPEPTAPPPPKQAPIAKPKAPAPPAPPAPPAAERPRAAPVSQHSGDSLAAFALGAGLKPADLAGIDETVLFETVGKMMKEFTGGLIMALRGRYEVKNEFHMQMTMMGPLENNPLKFSTSVSGTLLQLMSKKDPAFMSGAEAVRESFDDVNAHQTAVIAGMEASIQGILKRFNPKTLENRMKSDSVLDNILPGGRKAKYWEVFKMKFDDIASEVEDDSEKLFGREFSRAYEEQLARLKNQR